MHKHKAETVLASARREAATSITPCIACVTHLLVSLGVQYVTRRAHQPAGAHGEVV